MSKFQQLDKLHIEYENLLIKEIESMIELAYAHGWISQNVEEGKRIRSELQKLGSRVRASGED